MDQVTEDLVPAHLDREVVEEDRTDQDPHDLEHAEEDPLGGGAGCCRQRHPPHGNGEDDREGDGAKRGLPRGQLEDAQHHEEKGERQCRNEGRQGKVAPDREERLNE